MARTAKRKAKPKEPKPIPRQTCCDVARMWGAGYDPAEIERVTGVVVQRHGEAVRIGLLAMRQTDTARVDRQDPPRAAIS